MSTENTAVVAQEKNQLSPSERFSNAVLSKFASENGQIQITPFQKRLIQSYFVKIDQVLKMAEIKRVQKDEQYRESLAYSWDNINMSKLAVDVLAYSSVGLDPTQKNHLHPIPYKNNALGKYDVQFTLGYNGLELKAKKYGLDVPDDIVVRIVYANEVFTPKYKDFENKIESYIHKPSQDPFQKGDVIGGYYYYNYTESPEKNKLRVFSLHEIQKRIPKTASVEFWGGEKDKWEKDPSTGRNKKSGTERVEGWFDEMVWKTLKRAAFDAITIDSQKIDESIQQILTNDLQNEVIETTEQKVDFEIKTQANKETLDFSNVDEAEVVSEEVVQSKPQSELFKEEQPTEKNNSTTTVEPQF